MSVNNSNQEFKTREEYKRTKAEELQQKKDLVKRAKDEARQQKDAEKRAKHEALNQKLENPETPKLKETKTREALKKANTAEKDVDATPESYKRIRVRLIPIWLRIILLVVLVSISVMAGAIVGYGMLGGGKIAEVFQESTWTHIIDLVEKGK
jgi:DNA-directed RNA polymerase subunit beta